jgi:hypothetical protein
VTGGIDDDFRDRRQGDFIEEPCSLQVQTSVTQALTTGVACDGLIIVTQSCDLVRVREPYVQVARLFVEPDEGKRAELLGGHTPTRVPVPHRDDLFVDLTVVSTISKAAVAALPWRRTIASSEDAEEFAQALGRKTTRFAFPDEFQDAIKKFRDRVRKKHDRNSPEGRAWSKVRQIRATASEDWTDEQYEVTVTFVLDPAALPIGTDQDFDGAALDAIETMSISELCAAIDDHATRHLHTALWDRLVSAWIELGPGSQIVLIDAEAVSADEYLITEYWKSRRLDLDYLSDDEYTVEDG